MKQVCLVILWINAVWGYRQVYNVPNDFMGPAALQDAPRVTTSYDEMNNDRLSRLITLGEAKVDPQKHLLLNPIHHYDQDVEFVNDIKVAKGTFLS